MGYDGTPVEPPAPEMALCMQDALAGGEMSGSEGGAGRGETGAGLQMDETGVVPEDELLIRRPEGLEPEDEDEDDEETAGGVKWPLLSDPGLSRDGEGFFFAGRIFELPLLCCCCRHFALLFLNQTCQQIRHGIMIDMLMDGLEIT